MTACLKRFDTNAVRRAHDGGWQGAGTAEDEAEEATILRKAAVGCRVPAMPLTHAFLILSRSAARRKRLSAPRLARSTTATLNRRAPVQTAKFCSENWTRRVEMSQNSMMLMVRTA